MIILRAPTITVSTVAINGAKETLALPRARLVIDSNPEERELAA